MRIFLFIMCAAVMSSVSAQNPVIYPYNPDANNDSQVSTSDMLETLSVFGGSFLPNEILIDNTPLEEFLLVLQAQVLLLTDQATAIADLQSTIASLNADLDAQNLEVLNLQSQVISNYMIAQADNDALEISLAAAIANLQAADATLQTNIDNAVPQNLMNFNDMIMYSDGFLLDLTGHINMMGYLNADFIGAMGGLTAGNLDVWGNSYLNGDVSTGNLDVNGLSDFWGPMHQYGVILH